MDSWVTGHAVMCTSRTTELIAQAEPYALIGVAQQQWAPVSEALCQGMALP